MKKITTAKKSPLKIFDTYRERVNIKLKAYLSSICSVSNQQSELNLTNTTVTGNVSTATGDGCGSCSGGGIRIKGGEVTIIDSTISGNSAENEGGGFAAYKGTGTVT